MASPDLAASSSHSPLSSQIRHLLKARDWGYPGSLEPRVHLLPLCSLPSSGWLSAIRVKPGDNQEETSQDLSLTQHACRAGHDGGFGLRWDVSGSEPAFPLVLLGDGGTGRGKRSYVPRLSLQHAPLSPSLL